MVHLYEMQGARRCDRGRTCLRVTIAFMVELPHLGRALRTASTRGSGARGAARPAPTASGISCLRFGPLEVEGAILGIPGAELMAGHLKLVVEFKRKRSEACSAKLRMLVVASSFCGCFVRDELVAVARDVD